jgi:hypothetical protein
LDLIWLLTILTEVFAFSQYLQADVRFLTLCVIWCLNITLSPNFILHFCYRISSKFIHNELVCYMCIFGGGNGLLTLTPSTSATCLPPRPAIPFGTLPYLLKYNSPLRISRTQIFLYKREKKISHRKKLKTGRNRWSLFLWPILGISELGTRG